MDFSVLVDVGQWVLTGLGAAAAALHIVAPKTKNKKDDEISGKVDKAFAFVSKWLGVIVVPKTLKR